jgi:hypothetical protein
VAAAGEVCDARQGRLFGGRHADISEIEDGIAMAMQVSEDLPGIRMYTFPTV